MRSIATGAIIVGLLLFGLSAVWTTLFPPTNGWTPDKAAHSDEVKKKIYDMAFAMNGQKPNMQKGEDTGQMKAEFEALKKENAELDAEFNSITGSPRTISTFLKWSGLSIAAVGIIGWYAANQSR